MTTFDDRTTFVRSSFPHADGLTEHVHHLTP